MPKQKLEGYLSKSLKLHSDLFGYKLHNNPLAHQRTPADFVIHNRNGKTIYIECKECKIIADKGAFAFHRLTQEENLYMLDSFSGFICCYVMILFKQARFQNSVCFLVPFSEYIAFKHCFTKKSANINDFKVYLKQYILEPQKGSVYKLNSLEKL